MSLDQQGKTAAALELFKVVLDTPGYENLGADKVAQVRQRVDQLSQAPADLAIDSSPPGASVDVNGMKQAGATPLALRLAAGRHRITIEAPGYAPQVLELTVNPGEKVERSVVLVPSSAAPAPAVGTEQVAESSPRSRAPAFVTLGIAGASAVVGTVFGIKALDEKSQFDDAPSTNRADSVERNALIADMAFGVALTLGITGIVLLVADDAPGDQALAPEKRPSTGQIRLAPYVSPRGAGAGASVTF
jgi:hypothetical protein